MHALSSSGVVRQRSSLVGEVAGEVGEGDGFGVVAGEEGGDPLREVLFAGRELDVAVAYLQAARRRRGLLEVLGDLVRRVGGHEREVWEL